MAKEPLRVGVIGDSVMWGQGLARSDVFATQAAQQIGELLERPVDIVHFSARSGAKMVAEPGEAEEFVDRYPTLASHVDEVEEAAYKLYGEIPCAFPTVNHQLDTLSNTTSDLNLLILDGGANDVEFEDLLDPRIDPAYVDKLDPLFEEKIYRRMLDLLERSRRHFPRTMIIVTGYYPGLSDSTDHGQLMKVIRHFANQELGGKFEAFVVLNLIRLYAQLIPGDPVDGVLDQVQAQAEYGHSRVLYWLRRAVAETNGKAESDEDAEPTLPTDAPVLFAHPAFGDNNAIFAPESFIHEGYSLDTVQDAQADERAEHCPNNEHLGKMESLSSDLTNVSLNPTTPVLIDSLLQDLNGPTSLLEALAELKERGLNPTIMDPLQRRVISLLNKEISRIMLCRIASFIHPSPAGAEHYAERIVERWREAERASHSDKRDDVLDSIALRVHTRGDSVEKLFDAIELDLGTGRRWRLTHYSHKRANLAERHGGHFFPGTVDLFTIDPLDEVRLEDIRFLELHRVPWFERPPDPRRPWRPMRVDLELNGVSVFRSGPLDRNILRGRRLVLPYPLKEDVAVPDVVGKTHSEAVEILEQVGLHGGKGGAEFSDLPKGRISSQRPSGNKTVKRGSRVALKSSSGKLPIPPDKTRVPNVVGMRNEDAIVALKAVDFKSTLDFADSNRPFGIVVGQQPKPGTPVLPGSEIHLVASKGPGEDDPKDPDRPGGGGPIQPK